MRGPVTTRFAGTTVGDVIYAGDGNDVVRGGPGNDVLYAGEGNDVAWAGGGADVQFGGPDSDVLHALANDNTRDVMDCGAGVDVAYVIEHDPPVRLDARVSFA